MKTTLQFLMLVLAAGCAAAAFVGVTGIAPMSVFLTSNIAMMLYSMVGALLVSFNDYTAPRGIVLHTSRTTFRPIAL